ncbi:MAG: hypothetical protein JW860_16135 [Sedimentisphaerales bacterium]|nr:hypothetical protein [Sedimentisphaerales bacterium]
MNSAHASEIGNTLNELLSQEGVLYKQLHELAQRQGELVDGHDPELLLKVLAARQRLIDRISTIDRQIQPIREDWQKIAPELSEGQRLETQRLVDNVRRILGDILACDEKDFNALKTQKENVAEKIRTTSSGKKVNKAYAGVNNLAQSKYIDTCSK